MASKVVVSSLCDEALALARTDSCDKGAVLRLLKTASGQGDIACLYCLSSGRIVVRREVSFDSGGPSAVLRMARIQTPCEEGFTLIEVLCAFAILSLAAVVVLQSIQLASRSVASARERAEIKRVASEVLLERTLISDTGTAAEGTIGGIEWTVTAVTAGDPSGATVERLKLSYPGRRGASDFLIERRAAR